MPEKAFPLTIEQKTIIQENREKMFASEIQRLPGMEGTTVRQIGDFLRRRGHVNPQKLADTLEEWIREDGLPANYASVMQYLKYLREK